MKILFLMYNLARHTEIIAKQDEYGQLKNINET